MQVTGTMSLFPNAYVYGSEAWQEIEFLHGQTLDTLLGGNFTALGSNPAFGFSYAFTDIPWQQFGQGSDLFCGCTVTGYGNGLGFDVIINSINAGGTHTQGHLDMTGLGTVSLTGFDTSPVFWWLMSFDVDHPLAPTGEWTMFSIQTLPVPVPQVGTDALSLVAACGLMLLLAGRRIARNALPV